MLGCRKLSRFHRVDPDESEMPTLSSESVIVLYSVAQSHQSGQAKLSNPTRSFMCRASGEIHTGPAAEEL